MPEFLSAAAGYRHARGDRLMKYDADVLYGRSMPLEDHTEEGIGGQRIRPRPRQFRESKCDLFRSEGRWLSHCARHRDPCDQETGQRERRHQGNEMADAIEIDGSSPRRHKFFF